MWLAKTIAIELAGENEEPVGEGRTRVRAEPTVTHGIFFRQECVKRQVRGGMVVHDGVERVAVEASVGVGLLAVGIALIEREEWILLQKRESEPPHRTVPSQVPTGLDGHALEIMSRIEWEVARVRERLRPRSFGKRIDELLGQPIDVGAAAIEREITQNVIE